METYKDMTYSVRKDGTLRKRINIDGVPKDWYDTDVKSLYNKYIETRMSGINDTYTDNCKFKICAENWLKVNTAGKAETTIKEYKYIINKYLIPYFGNMNIKKIKPHDIQILQSDLLEGKHNELAHKCIRFMNTILNDAIANGYLGKNPCMSIKQAKVIHKERQILTSTQDKILLESNHKYANFFRILRYTGMRRQEIVPLLVDKDIDLKNKKIIINKAVSFAQNQPSLKSTKNEKSRIVPIPDIIFEDLKKQVDFCKKNDIKYLFTKQTDTNAMLTQESIRCMSNSFCNEIGFTFTPHQLRHSYCTMLYYSGVGMKEAQSLMGHSSAKMVYDIYTHLDEEKDNSTSKINNFLGEKKKRNLKLRGKIRGISLF